MWTVTVSLPASPTGSVDTVTGTLGGRRQKALVVMEGSGNTLRSAVFTPTLTSVTSLEPGEGPKSADAETAPLSALHIPT